MTSKGRVVIAGGLATVLSILPALLSSIFLLPNEFSLIVAWFSAVGFLGVVTLALQTQVARSHAQSFSRPDGTRGRVYKTEIDAELLGSIVISLTLFMLVTAPIMINLARFPIWMWVAAWLAVVLQIPSAFAIGVNQGRENYSHLWKLIIFTTVPRAAFPVIALVLQPSVAHVVTGFCAGTLLGTLLTLREVTTNLKVKPSRLFASLRDFLPILLGLIGILSLTTWDILMTRATLTPLESASYGVGSLISRSILAIPTVLTVLWFPLFVRNARGLFARVQLGLAIGTSLMAVSLYLLVTSVSPPSTAPDQLVEIWSHLWVFVLLGGALAAIQTAVYQEVSQRRKLHIWLLPLTLCAVALVLGITEIRTAESAATLFLSFFSVLAVVLTFSSLKAMRAQEAQHGATNGLW